MRALLATALAALASPALAQDIGGTVSLELGNVHNSDQAWDLFSDANGMPSRGIRGGVRIGENVSVLAGWHRVRRGAEVYVPGSRSGDYDYDYYYGYSESALVMAFFADELTLGVQGGIPIAKVLYPYAAIDGMVMRGVMKLDADTSTKKNPNQLRAQSWLPGVLTMGGVEVRSPTASKGWQIAAHSEFGYSWFLPGNFDDFGPMKPGGFTVRGGLGMRF